MSSKKYTPINCSQYDLLEAAITLRKTVELGLADGTKVATQLSDLFARDKQEFVKLQDGRVLRLDEVISIDGEIIHLSCEKD